MDRLAASFRLIYYDQRERGRSAEGVKPEDVTIASDVEDCGSQVGSHSLRTTVDGHGRPWTRKPVVPGRVDACGHSRSALGDLRIRRLGVRVAPGALSETPAVQRLALHWSSSTF